MHSILRNPALAAGLLLSCGAALLAQPAVAREQPWVQAPAAVQPGVVVDRDDHDGWRHGGRDGWRRDERAPAIFDLTPLPGDRVGERYRMTVSARFADRASGIDPASVRLRIDGRDVTGAARVDEDEVRFHNNLFPGRHVAEVVVRDRAGNTARRAWQFDVLDRDRWGRGDGEGWGREGWRRGGWDGQR